MVVVAAQNTELVSFDDDDTGKGAEDFPVLVYALLFYSSHDI